jgi:hypothetical protein
MIVGACLPSTDRGFTTGSQRDVSAPRMTVTVTQRDGRPAAEADITCGGSPGNGLVLPELGAPFHVTASAAGASVWEVFAYAIPRVDVGRSTPLTG